MRRPALIRAGLLAAATALSAGTAFAATAVPISSGTGGKVSLKSSHKTVAIDEKFNLTAHYVLPTGETGGSLTFFENDDGVLPKCSATIGGEVFDQQAGSSVEELKQISNLTPGTGKYTAKGYRFRNRAAAGKHTFCVYLWFNAVGGSAPEQLVGRIVVKVK
jgi:hypothetical protein